MINLKDRVIHVVSAAYMQIRYICHIPQIYSWYIVQKVTEVVWYVFWRLVIPRYKDTTRTRWDTRNYVSIHKVTTGYFSVYLNIFYDWNSWKQSAQRQVIRTVWITWLIVEYNTCIPPVRNVSCCRHDE